MSARSVMSWITRPSNLLWILRPSNLADVATVAATGIAIWAFYHPAVVSDFLDAIERNTNKSAESLESIDSSSTSTADNTARIVSEIPYWLQFGEVPPEALTNFSSILSSRNLSFRVSNDSNTLFDRVSLRVVDFDTGRVIYEIDDHAIPPREQIQVNVDNRYGGTKRNILCITARNTSTANTITETRVIQREGEGRSLLLRTLSWDLQEGDHLSECLDY